MSQNHEPRRRPVNRPAALEWTVMVGLVLVVVAAYLAVLT